MVIADMAKPIDRLPYFEQLFQNMGCLPSGRSVANSQLCGSNELLLRLRLRGSHDGQR